MFTGHETVMNNEETTDCRMGQVTSKQEEDIPSSKGTCYMIAPAPNINVKKVTTVVNNDCHLLIHERRSDECGNRTCDQMVQEIRRKEICSGLPPRLVKEPYHLGKSNYKSSVCWNKTEIICHSLNSVKQNPSGQATSSSPI